MDSSIILGVWKTVVFLGVDWLCGVVCGLLPVLWVGSGDFLAAVLWRCCGLASYNLCLRILMRAIFFSMSYPTRPPGSLRKGFFPGFDGIFFPVVGPSL